MVGWMALSDSISVYIQSSLRGREMMDIRLVILCPFQQYSSHIRTMGV